MHGARTPGKLDYAIAAEPATVHDLLLQKSDGDLRPGRVGREAERRLGHGHGRPRHVALGGHRLRPDEGTAPTQTLHNASAVALTLSDHPVVIEL